MKNPEIKYYKSDIEKVFQKLISEWGELTEFYNTEIKFASEGSNDRLAYIDMGDISRFIVEKKKIGLTKNFGQFFDNVEDIFKHGDNYVRELIVIGLFEGIQNIGGSEIDYYRSFDEWLKNSSLNAWRGLIDYWEKDDWKKNAESEKILNSKK